ncbi:hypothetical protein CMV_023568 [Castanea mollissima]|uniref:Uncharacterized protein n=1 Tax=Castanea mollissima TaxID=60419 RepID=A0A8J4VAH6_9ROSI|nr:hypothetical protein CMV_023568 [Castanea mollissima]
MKKCNKSTAKAKYTREGSTQFQALNFFKKATLSCCLMVRGSIGNPNFFLRSRFFSCLLPEMRFYIQKLVGNGPRLLESLIECILEGCSGPILLQCMEYKNRPEFLISKVSQYYNYVVWHG